MLREIVRQVVQSKESRDKILVSLIQRAVVIVLEMDLTIRPLSRFLL